MPKLINCECGEVVHGSSVEELIKAVEAHVSQHHPALIGKLSRQDILAMSEENEWMGGHQNQSLVGSTRVQICITDITKRK